MRPRLSSGALLFSFDVLHLGAPQKSVAVVLSATILVSGLAPSTRSYGPQTKGRFASGALLFGVKK